MLLGAPVFFLQNTVASALNMACASQLKSSSVRVQKALLTIALFAIYKVNASTTEPIKRLHKIAKSAFVGIFRFSQSDMRF